jgi:hypothetical protein
MSTSLRWSSFETWHKLMTPPFLWKYPTFHIQGTRRFGCIAKSNKRQVLCTIIGESVIFISLLLVPCVLLLAEVLTAQNFGLLPNLVLLICTASSYGSLLFSYVLFNNRELFVSTMAHVVQLESQLSNGK